MSSAMNSTLPATTLVNNHRQDAWLAVCIVMIVVETVFFALRVSCRWTSRVSWGPDDYLTAVAYISCMILNAIGIVTTTRTWVGQHTADVYAVDPENVARFIKLTPAHALAYIFAATTPKMAIVALFLRIFIQRAFRIVCWVVQALFILYIVAVVISIGINMPCYVNTDHPCPVNAGGMSLGIFVFNIVTDVALILLPMHVVWQLQRSNSEKIALLGTFGLGLIGLAFSIARLVAWFKYFSGSQPDIMWDSAQMSLFTNLEPASYFLVACMISFRQLLRLPICGGGKRRSRQSDSDEFKRGSSGSDPAFLRNSWLARRHDSAILGYPEEAEAHENLGVWSKRLEGISVTPIDASLEKEDSEREISPHTWRRPSHGSMIAQITADELSRAHNRPNHPHTVVVVSADSTAASRNQSRSATSELDGEAEQTNELRDANAIVVKHEVEITTAAVSKTED